MLDRRPGGEGVLGSDTTAILSEYSISPIVNRTCYCVKGENWTRFWRHLFSDLHMLRGSGNKYRRTLVPSAGFRGGVGGNCPGHPHQRGMHPHRWFLGASIERITIFFCFITKICGTKKGKWTPSHRRLPRASTHIGYLNPALDVPMHYIVNTAHIGTAWGPRRANKAFSSTHL
jgi:hypothetical protein